MEQRKSSGAQEKVTTEVKKRNAGETARESAIRTGAVSSGFAPFLGRNMGRCRLVWVRSACDHDIQG